MNKESFLSDLYKKKAMILEMGEEGINIEGALKEVNRQIQQCLRGNIITGEGVTKSGKED